MTTDAVTRPIHRGGEIGWSLGAFTVSLKTALPHLHDSVRFIYGRHPAAGPGTFIDFPIQVNGIDLGPRRLFRPRAGFRVGSRTPLYPTPRRHAPLLLESGINWVIGSEMHGYLLLHAAVVARGGDALVLPAPSGSGKSTLAAGLMAAGWRLLADEFAVIDMETSAIHPCLKAISLKNDAIAVMRERLPGELLPDVYLTQRGHVGLLRPSAASVQAVGQSARVKWVVSPRFAPGRELSLSRVPRSQAFVTMASNTFNYDVLERQGFHALADVVSGADGYQLTHGNLDAAVAAVDRITRDA